MFPAANVKDVSDIPEDVREQLELMPVATMDDVFAVALHRVIVPQRIAGNYVIEVRGRRSRTPEPEVRAQPRRRTARPIDVAVAADRAAVAPSATRAVDYYRAPRPRRPRRALHRRARAPQIVGDHGARFVGLRRRHEDLAPVRRRPVARAPMP